MSIQEQLMKHAQDPAVGGVPGGEKFPEGAAGMEEMEKTMQATPIPGQSLTQDPSSKMPYETPPKYTDLQDFVDESFLTMSNPEKLPLLFKSLRNGTPIEYVAQKYLEKEMQEGNINTDLLLQAIEPTIYILIHLATYAGIEPVLYPEDSMLDEDTPQQVQMFKQATASLVPKETREYGIQAEDLKSIQAPVNVPKSLLQRTKAAVDKSGDTYE